MQPLKDNHPAGALVERYCAPSTFTQEFAFQVVASPHGHRYYVDTAWIANDADIASLLEKSAQTIPNNTSVILYMPVTSSQRPVNGDTAFSLQSKHFVSLYAGWKEEKDDEETISWVRKAFETIAPHSVGSMVSDFDFQNRDTRHWDEEKGAKVMALRRKWDPKGRFAGFLDKGDKSGIDGLKTSFAELPAPSL